MADLELAHAFERFVESPSTASEGALLVARVIDPIVDTGWCRLELARHAAAVPRHSLQGLLGYLRQQGFRGAKNYYQVQNSSLHHVLTNREGIPITLAVVLLTLAERINLPSTGINFPGHFLVEISGTLVDPFTLSTTSRAQCRERLAPQQISLDQALTPTTPREIVERMLNNLSGLAHYGKDYTTAIELTDFKLLVTTNRLPVLIERASLWRSLGVTDMARLELREAINLAPPGTLRQKLASHLQELRSEPSRLH